MISDKVIEACARAAHEANRAYCLALGDESQKAWSDADNWQQASARNGVREALDGKSPEQLHESWLAEKFATGWKYGPVKDPEKLEHPCCVPYDQLPVAQQAKDRIFRTVVGAVFSALEDAARAEPE